MKNSIEFVFAKILLLFYIMSVLYFLFMGEFGKVFIIIISILFLYVSSKLYLYKFYIIDKNLFVTSNIFILSSFVLGSSYDFYDKIKYYDDLLHFSSGFICVKIGFNILEFLNIDTMLSKILFFVVLFLFAMGFAPLCEIYEYLADSFLGLNTQSGGLDDTMKDMIDSFLGVVIMLSFYLFKSSTIKDVK